MEVSQRFAVLLDNLKLTSTQQEDGRTKHAGVRSALNTHYYGTSSQYTNSLLVGSWGKSTATRPPRDIDVMFVLPLSVYERYERVTGNKQSQLLQEVKGVLQRAYPSTTMRADGQVIIVPFTSYAVEVVPAFVLTSGQYYICDTNGGGKYKTVDPVAEEKAISASDGQTNGNARNLIRMMKRWQDYCAVPIKSFWIELLVTNFLLTYTYANKPTVYYDWMVRDFLTFLVSRSNTYANAPGTGELIWLSDAWKSRAESAESRAKKACTYESDKKGDAAGEEWQKIFGTDIPRG